MRENYKLKGPTNYLEIFECRIEKGYNQTKDAAISRILFYRCLLTDCHFRTVCVIREKMKNSKSFEGLRTS